MKSLIIRIFRQMINDRRTLLLMLVAPLLILTLLYFLLGESNYKPKLLVSSKVPQQIVQILSDNASVRPVESDTPDWLEGADSQLASGDADALLYTNGQGLVVRMKESGSAKGTSVAAALQKALAQINPAGSLQHEYLYGPADDKVFDNLSYILLGVLSFFFIFIISGITFVRERESGTLERMMISPVRRSSVVAGYTFGYGQFAALQAVLMILFSHYVLGMKFSGSILTAILIMILLAFTAVSSGAFVSIFANNEFQVMQFIPIVIIPQIFFSGLLDLDALPYGLGKLAWVMPIHYGCSALHEVIVNGRGLASILLPLSGLLVFNAALFALNIVALRKYRQI